MEKIDEIMGAYAYPRELDDVSAEVARLKGDSARWLGDGAALQTMFNAIDLTTLSHTDSSASVRRFVERVNQFGVDYPGLKNVGGICVYSVFAPVVKETLRVAGVHRAVVAACFPSSQSFADIKAAEVRRSVEAGATEVDVVISVGEFLEGEYGFVYEELTRLREACGDARLKVILETGALGSHERIWDASVIAMAAGADFIKTSTGKNCEGASPEAAIVMTRAIKAYEGRTGRKVGFKPAGGVRTPEDAAFYYETVRQTLGDDHTVNTLFRIGASGLANNLLKRILEVEGKPAPEKYF